jgi:hypothetical protein
MAIIAKAGGSYKLAPAGLHQGVCVDVVDLGEEKSEKYGKTQPKVRLIWQISEIDPETTKPYLISRKYTNSLGEKATLRKDLEGWRGRPFSKEELMGFDLERLLGVGAQLMIVHTEKEGGTYSNVQAIVPVAKGAERLLPRDYVRVINRPKEEQGQEHEVAAEEEVPF